jgi:hypothetical protein
MSTTAKSNRDGRHFAGQQLAEADLLEDALLGAPAGPDELRAQAHDAAAGLLALIDAGLV